MPEDFREKQARFFVPALSAAFTLVAVIAYSLINGVWVCLVYNGEPLSFFVFETPGYVGLLLPFASILALIWIQVALPKYRLPMISNFVLALTICSWFWVVWSIVARASAAV